MAQQSESAPRVGVTSAGAHLLASTPEVSWQVRWDVENLDLESLELLDAHLPHKQFLAKSQDLGRQALGPRESYRLELNVASGEPPGSVIDNAFLILRVQRGENQWRVFSRLLVRFGPDGHLEQTCTLIAVHPVGFSRAIS